MDPAKIDINVHPTKTEIKFEDERLMYNYLRVSLRHALGQYSLTPMIDFGTDTNFTRNLGQNLGDDRSIKQAYQQQPSSSGSGTQPSGSSSWQTPKSSKDWQDVYRGMLDINQPETEVHPDAKHIEQEAYHLGLDESSSIGASNAPMQLQNTYIVSKLKSALLLIDQQAAHERILYEIYLERLQNGELASQRELFPISIELSPAKASVLKNILDRINALGFDMSEFGHNSFVIHGTPVGLDGSTPIDQVVETLLDQYSQNIEVELSIEENLARSMAASSCVKRGRKLEKEEMINIIDQLFACKMPAKSPAGKKCFITIDGDELAARFK
jgi:DNA mismatch repair protein MutL